MKEKLNTLLEKLDKIYDESDIKKYCTHQKQSWGYSLVITPMEPGAPLILGFNWGASQGEKYENQSNIEKTNFLNVKDIGSLKRIFPFIYQHLGEDYLVKTSQSNYCFFRSKAENQISEADIKRCSGIFDELIEVLAPSSIICLSAKLRKYMIMTEKVCNRQEKTISFNRGNANIEFVAIRGTLASGVGINFLPHPNYPMTCEARSKAWQFCYKPT